MQDLACTMCSIFISHCDVTFVKYSTSKLSLTTEPIYFPRVHITVEKQCFTVASVSIWPQQCRLKLINLSDRHSNKNSKLCWYSVSTSPLIGEKQNTDQADWPLIEGMSLWLCGMKFDWLKWGNYSLGRQSCTAECHFTWLISFRFACL